MKPVARRQGLIVREFPDETLVYDLTRHEAHCLNLPAALVFKHSDGQTSVAELAKRLRRRLGNGADEAWVALALHRLDKAHLLDHKPKTPADTPSRREMLKRFGRAAALPIVISLLAPTPAAAVASCVSNCSGRPDRTPCDLDCATCCCCGGACSCPCAC